MFKGKKKYLLIPFNQELNICDFYLKNAMDFVANSKGYKNHKFYIRKEFGCSGNSIKKMTEHILYPLALFLDQRNFPTKDSYRYIKKVDINNYSKIINTVISEYVKIAPPHERNTLREYIEKWNLNPESYQQVFCHPVFWGFTLVEMDEETANKINRINNASSVYKTIIDELTKSEVEVKS